MKDDGSSVIPVLTSQSSAPCSDIEITPQRGDSAKPPVMQRATDDEKGVVYQIMYSQSQHSETNFNRPVTPLQLSSDGSPPTVPVSCGTAHGKMHLNMFLCPGIHQPCIEICGDLLSPKQFTVRGDKERQKDWKASIRVGKSSLRTHMEAQTIDFFDHTNRCSGKCQSRNYVNAPVEREEVIQMRKAKRNADISILKNEIESEIAGKEVEAEKNSTSFGHSDARNSDGVTAGKKTRGRPRGSVNKPRAPTKIESQDDQYYGGDYYTEAPQPVAVPAPPMQPEHPLTSSDHLPHHIHNEIMMQTQERFNGCSSFNDIMHCLQDEPFHFWSQMQQTGVIGHFCDDIIVSALNLKQSATEQPLNAIVASMLSRSAFALGVQNVIVHRVQTIERSVHQQRKHEEMIMEIEAKVAEDQRRKQMSQQIEEEDVQTAQEVPPGQSTDSSKFGDYPSTSSGPYILDPPAESLQPQQF